MIRRLSVVAQALSDPFRLRILKLLALRDLCVCELVYLLPAGQSRVSQNLAILRNAGLVTDTRQGRWVSYALNRTACEQALAEMSAWLAEATLDGLPDMAGEAARWQTMPADNPRGVCQSPTGAAEASDNTLNPLVMEQIARERKAGMIAVKVLGSGCPNCQRVEQTAKAAAEELGLEATFQKVTKLDEILAYDITTTPGLVINERVVCSGRVPARAEVTTWLASAAEAA